MEKSDLLRYLQSLIGRGFAYRGEVVVLIDVLREEEAVVLDRRGGPTSIQSDQFGRPLRRIAGSSVLPVFAGESRRISEELRELLASPVTTEVG